MTSLAALVIEGSTDPYTHKSLIVMVNIPPLCSEHSWLATHFNRDDICKVWHHQPHTLEKIKKNEIEDSRPKVSVIKQKVFKWWQKTTRVGVKSGWETLFSLKAPFTRGKQMPMMCEGAWKKCVEQSMQLFTLYNMLLFTHTKLEVPTQTPHKNDPS